jgi:hypothetical protein
MTTVVARYESVQGKNALFYRTPLPDGSMALGTNHLKPEMYAYAYAGGVAYLTGRLRLL